MFTKIVPVEFKRKHDELLLFIVRSSTLISHVEYILDMKRKTFYVQDVRGVRLWKQARNLDERFKRNSPGEIISNIKSVESHYALRSKHFSGQF